MTQLLNAGAGRNFRKELEKGDEFGTDTGGSRVLTQSLWAVVLKVASR